jgi:hypothetical protein
LIEIADGLQPIVFSECGCVHATGSTLIDHSEDLCDATESPTSLGIGVTDQSIAAPASAPRRSFTIA